MKKRCHLLAVAVLTGLNGCGVGELIFGARKDDLGVKPVGPENMATVDATAQFDKVKDPKISVDTRFAAGQLAEAQGNAGKAAEQYETVLKAKPEHHGALYRLGVLHATAGRHDEAVALWKRYIDATHHSAVGYSNLGFCYELAGKPDLAEKAYVAGIERDSESAPCRVNYGLMLARHDRVNEGRLQLDMALSEAEVYYNIGSVFEGQGRKEQARAEYMRALELDPQLKDASARLRTLDSVTSVNPTE